MVADMTERISNGINKKKMRKLLYIYIAIIVVLVFSSRTIYNISLPRVTVAMPQTGWIAREFEARAVVEFSETFEVFSRTSGWIEDIFVQPGDVIAQNTIIAASSPVSPITEAELADMAANIEQIEIRLARLNLTRSETHKSLQTLVTGGNILHQQWAVEDAEAGLKRHYNELMELQQLTALGQLEHFTYANPTTKAEREWNRLAAEWMEAEAAWQNFITDKEAFDSLIYERAIEEASITLERSIRALEEAEANLADTRGTRAPAFDERTYQNAINSARTTHERAIADYNLAHQQHDTAWHQLNDLWAIGAEPEAIATAQAALVEAQNRITQAQLARDDAKNTLNQATDSKRKAQDAFTKTNQETREKAIEEAERQVKLAENNLADATRAYENAVIDLERARTAALTEAEKKVENALQALNESAWNTQNDLIHAEKNLATAYQDLKRANDALIAHMDTLLSQENDIRRNLELDLQRTNLDIASANLDLQAARLSFETASDASMATILAPFQGIVIDFEKSKGQFVSQGARIATMAVNNNRFTVEFSAPVSETGFIEVGDEAIIIKSGSNISITAFVYEIVPTGDNLLIRLRSETDQFNGGEYVRVKISKQTGPHHMLVPNDAVFSGDMGQYYIWTVHSRHGALGTEYYVTKMNVFVVDADGLYTAITRGASGYTMNMPVVTSYSRDLTVNGRVSRME